VGGTKSFEKRYTTKKLWEGENEGEKQPAFPCKDATALSKGLD